LYSTEYCGEVGKRILIELYETVGTKQDFEITSLRSSMDELVQSIKQISSDFISWLEDLVEELKLTDQTDVLAEFKDLEKVSLFIVLSPSGSSFDEFKNVTDRSDWWVSKVKSLK
jgi:UDP-N-acetylmuramoylalanine-D-glutamate ligase